MQTRTRRRPDETEPQRRPVAAAPLPAEALLALQRTAGNVSVARLLGRQPATRRARRPAAVSDVDEAGDPADPA